MKIEKRVELPVLTGVTLHLTLDEWHDLQVIANIDAGAMCVALKTSKAPWLNEGTQTNHVYGLLNDIRESA